MKKILITHFLIYLFCIDTEAQFNYVDEFSVNFKIDNVELGVDEDIVNVSGKSADNKWNVKMTWKFTNVFGTDGSGEYTAIAWAQDGENFLQTTVRGIWKRNGEVFDVKHFENGTDGNQLLTTGTFDFVENTYNCVVRVIE